MQDGAHRKSARREVRNILFEIFSNSTIRGMNTPVTDEEDIMGTLWRLIALLMGLVTPALADGVELSREHTACMENTGNANEALINCNNMEIARQDLRLNKAYKSLMGQLTPQRKKDLQKVQRTWIAFRDGNCRFYLDPASRFPSQLSASACVLQATAERVRELERFQK